MSCYVDNLLVVMLIICWLSSWEPPEKNEVAAGRGVSEASRGCSPCGLCGS